MGSIIVLINPKKESAILLVMTRNIGFTDIPFAVTNFPYIVSINKFMANCSDESW